MTAPRPRPFPWRQAMAAGLGVLRLAPEQFWAMTPRELQAALEGVFGSAAGTGAPSRGELEHLMENHPDSGEKA